MYLSKELLLKAANKISQLDNGNIQQGLTKKVSYVRYFLALDEFCKQKNVDKLDTTDLSQKKDFTNCVEHVVGIEKSKRYTTNFIEIKKLTDCGVGSNFFGGGPVQVSQKSPNILNYPSVGTPLLSVQNQQVWMLDSAYENILSYLGNEEIRVALFLWIARAYDGFSTEENLCAELQDFIGDEYSIDLMNAIYPSADAIVEFVNEADAIVLSEDCATFGDNDLMNAPKSSCDGFDYPHQLITYGAPGTGKSHGTDKNLKDKNGNPRAECYRTTFHPDSDYASFVGAYKPTMKEDKIVYSFRPQAFMEAYVKAWRIAAGREEANNLPVVLVIEEINRGNCAQVFGDLFQLLDRDDATGYSSYPITADVDLAKWLAESEQFGANGLSGIEKPACIKQADWDLIMKGEMLALPPNLYIWATMNTSDQSLFPIDSAFKRRWDWKYVPIIKPDKDDDDSWIDRAIEVEPHKKAADGNLTAETEKKYFDWWNFVRIVNEAVGESAAGEDKKLGYFFVKAPDTTGIITTDQLVNKVLFYLLKDVFRDDDLPALFCRAGNKKPYSFEDFFYDESKDGHKAGDINPDVVAEFLAAMKSKNGDIKLEAFGEAPKSNGAKKSQQAAS